MPRSERKAAREKIKRKREQEEAEKKAKEAERERIINEAIKKRLDKAERVKTAQYYEKFMDPDNEQEDDTLVFQHILDGAKSPDANAAQSVSQMRIQSCLRTALIPTSKPRRLMM